MKQHLLFLCFLFAQSIHAQDFPYDFSVEQGVYTPLQNAISANNGMVWDDPSIEAPLGFDFQFFGQTASTLYWYGGTAFNVFGLPANTTPLIIAYGSDLIDRGYDVGISQSPISYKTEGSPGNRIFKMEWSNAGFYDDAPGTAPGVRASGRRRPFARRRERRPPHRACCSRPPTRRPDLRASAGRPLPPSSDRRLEPTAGRSWRHRQTWPPAAPATWPVGRPGRWFGPLRPDAEPVPLP